MNILHTNPPFHYIITKIKILLSLPYLHQINEHLPLLQQTPQTPHLCTRLSKLFLKIYLTSPKIPLSLVSLSTFLNQINSKEAS